MKCYCENDTNINELEITCLSLFTSLYLPLGPKCLKSNGAIDVAAKRMRNSRNMKNQLTHHLVILEEFGYTESELDFDWAKPSNMRKKWTKRYGFYDKATQKS